MSLNSEIRVGQEYVRLVRRRLRRDEVESLIPIDHVIDWEDQPSRFKVYSGVTRTPLRADLPSRLGSAADLLGMRAEIAQYKSLDYEALSALLLLANGILRRKLDVNWNLDHPVLASFSSAVYSRAAASGGGMYPCELYLVAGRGGPVLPGVYHFDTAHHALETLRLGDLTGQVRAAVGADSEAASASHYLLVSINFWKNSFKYHNFSYHVVTQDLGAVLSVVDLAARALAVRSSTVLWFRDEMLNELLGLELDEESVFAVVALEPAPENRQCISAANPDGRHSMAETLFGGALPPVGHQSYQRSSRIVKLQKVEEVHRSTLITDEPRPALMAGVATASERVPGTDGIELPPPDFALLQQDMSKAMMGRSSSWGSMTARPPLDLQTLATLVHCYSRSSEHHSDLADCLSAMPIKRLMFFANHIAGLEQGVYSFDEKTNSVNKVSTGDHAIRLQQCYSLQNYNMDQVSVAFAIVGRVERALQVFGNRGLRILNAEAGMAAQSFYMTSAALSLGCGAVLGFDTEAVDALLEVDGTSETCLLMVLVGNQRANAATFDYRLVG